MVLAQVHQRLKRDFTGSEVLFTDKHLKKCYQFLSFKNNWLVIHTTMHCCPIRALLFGLNNYSVHLSVPYETLIDYLFTSYLVNLPLPIIA